MTDDSETPPAPQSTKLIEAAGHLQLAIATTAGTTYAMCAGPFRIAEYRKSLAVIRDSLDKAEQAALQFVCEAAQAEGQA